MSSARRLRKPRRRLFALTVPYEVLRIHARLEDLKRERYPMFRIKWKRKAME